MLIVFHQILSDYCFQRRGIFRFLPLLSRLCTHKCSLMTLGLGIKSLLAIKEFLYIPPSSVDPKLHAGMFPRCRQLSCLIYRFVPTSKSFLIQSWVVFEVFIFTFFSEHYHGCSLLLYFTEVHGQDLSSV